MANRRGGKFAEEAKSGGIDKYLLLCNNQITTLAQKLRDDDYDGIEPTKVNGWKARILEISASSAVLDNALQIAKRVIDSESTRLRQNRGDGSSSSSASASASSSSSSAEHNENDENAASISKHMDDLVESEKALFDPSTSKFVVSVKKLIQDDDDEDIRVRENLSEETFKCPILLMKIVDPVTNGLCCHVASRGGLMSLFRGRSATPCFQSGCGAIWTRDNMREDATFQDNMERFFRQRERSSAYTQRAGGVDIDDEDDD